MPPRVFFLTALICLGAFVARGEMRDWTDREGRSFRGELYEVDAGVVKVRRESDFRIFELQLKQLSDADQQWIAEQQKPKKSPEPTAAPVPEYPTKELDRSLIPTYDQSDFRNSGTCGPSAIMNFMMWWGEHLYPELLPGGDQETKAKRTMQRLIRTCDTSGGTHEHEMEKGLHEFFERYAPEYSVDIVWQKYPDPDWLHTAAQGNNLVVLTLGYFADVTRTDRRGGHYVSLVSSNDDQATVHTWGKIYPVTLIPCKRATSLREISEGVYQRVYQDVYQAYRHLLEGKDPDKAGLWNEYVGLIESAMLAKIRPATVAELNERDKKR